MATRSTPTYLLHQPRSRHFYFRMRLPDTLQAILFRKELKYSLGTSDEMEARYRALRLFRMLQGILSDRSAMKTLTKEELDRLMKQFLRQWIDHEEKLILSRTTPWAREDLAGYLEALDQRASSVKDNLVLCDYRDATHWANDLLKENQIEGIEEGSEAFRSLCRELLRTFTKALEIGRRRAGGDYSDILPELPAVGGNSDVAPEVPQPSQIALIQPQETQENVKPLSALIESFTKEQIHANVWSVKTEKDYESSFRLLIDIIGDLPVTTIDAAALRQFKETLLKIPPNIKKSPQHRDKTLDEILQMGTSSTIGTLTINKHISRASALFEWAVNNGCITRNPVVGKMQLKTNKMASEERAVFTSSDLGQLFRSKAYLEDKHLHAWGFWIPVIGLFTGMRLDEIAQLHLEDIRDDQGILVIDVNDTGVKKLKNKSSRRIIPVHDFLAQGLELPQYVNRLQENGHSRLFPELKQRRDGFSHYVSRWFSTYRKVCGIQDGEGKVFHSFRHTFVDTLKQLGIEKSFIGAVVGHSDDSETFGRYGKSYSPAILKERVIDRLTFDVDLGHLRRSKFAKGAA